MLKIKVLSREIRGEIGSAEYRSASAVIAVNDGCSSDGDGGVGGGEKHWFYCVREVKRAEGCSKNHKN